MVCQWEQLFGTVMKCITHCPLIFGGLKQDCGDHIHLYKLGCLTCNSANCTESAESDATAIHKTQCNIYWISI